ncbi:MAG: SDR family oxidoreductase [Planctomycetales bacterium]|nr:SDR family oxidoreductase [Planctomycetales bacterium]
MPSPRCRSILVTGCSSGIGRATVAALLAEDFHVFAGVRSTADAERLQAEFGDGVTALTLDVTRAEQIRHAAEDVRRLAPEGLAALVNNAGVGAPGPIELADPEELRRLFEVNAIGALQMMQAFLPHLRRGSGRIVNLSSMNGVISLPMVGAYSASKFALEAISDALRIELMPWKIPVVVIRPGQVRTPIFGKARVEIERRRGEVPAHLATGYETPYRRTAKFNDRGDQSATSPEAVARVIVKAITCRRPRRQYHVGWDAIGLRIAQRFVPGRLLDRALGRAIGSLRRQPRPQDEPAQSPAAAASGSPIGP